VSRAAVPPGGTRRIGDCRLPASLRPVFVDEKIGGGVKLAVTLRFHVLVEPHSFFHLITASAAFRAVRSPPAIVLTVQSCHGCYHLAISARYDPAVPRASVRGRLENVNARACDSSANARRCRGPHLDALRGRTGLRGRASPGGTALRCWVCGASTRTITARSSRRQEVTMTRLSADQPCEACGGLLVPPQIVTGVPVPPDADYICLKCGSPYRWAGNQLTRFQRTPRPQE
jgi:hypothetical protein